ncbi:interleukin-15 receptor subunit alpha isoform X3 [Artibeus jamaicensis]|uniref:interleukin-15 receptor subunit alpha isoform X3 n=1 Tax=Artibeus jamaicensis TaxID=9417 RepID=UPI00235B2377|nr:interleukin-15 receptor subunit alpha isoform X3 [Artibeus jamaicensis]
MVVESKARTRLLRDCWLSNIPTLLLLLLLLRPPATLGATCSTPISVEHANIQVKSYNENSRERYICNFGFKRKAGTSSLTKCLRNEDTNITQWTIPSLKCIRDPSLTRPRPPSTVAPAGVTPEPDSPSPSGKEPAFTTMATKPGTTPGSRLMTPKPPSAETTEITGNEPSQDQSQTTAKALEHTLSASEEKPGAYAYSSTAVTVAVSIPVLVICGVCVAFLLVRHCKKSRQNSWTPSVQMENMEDTPMTGGTDGREEDAENHHTA